MLKSFKDKVTQDIFDGTHSRATRKLGPELLKIARRRLDYINAAKALLDLRIPPGNRLEALQGNLKGYHSIRINDQWRIVFRWEDGDAFEVRMEDYH
ncbi:type II toxin-antitoxin system RelE/ParE family toxin [Bdellovibrionota bacterium FG-2]